MHISHLRWSSMQATESVEQHGREVEKMAEFQKSAYYQRSNFNLTLHTVQLDLSKPRLRSWRRVPKKKSPFLTLMHYDLVLPFLLFSLPVKRLSKNKKNTHTHSHKQKEKMACWSSWKRKLLSCSYSSVALTMNVMQRFTKERKCGPTWYVCYQGLFEVHFMSCCCCRRRRRRRSSSLLLQNITSGFVSMHILQVLKLLGLVLHTVTAEVNWWRTYPSSCSKAFSFLMPSWFTQLHEVKVQRVTMNEKRTRGEKNESLFL